METLDLDKTRESFLSECKSSFIAIDTELANSQHYELPTMFYEKILGNNMKYSGSIWGRNGANLDDADYSTLDIYIERGAPDGHKITFYNKGDEEPGMPFYRSDLQLP